MKASEINVMKFLYQISLSHGILRWLYSVLGEQAMLGLIELMEIHLKYRMDFISLESKLIFF